MTKRRLGRRLQIAIGSLMFGIMYVWWFMMKTSLVVVRYCKEMLNGNLPDTPVQTQLKMTYDDLWCYFIRFWTELLLCSFVASFFNLELFADEAKDVSVNV